MRWQGLPTRYQRPRTRSQGCTRASKGCTLCGLPTRSSNARDLSRPRSISGRAASSSAKYASAVMLDAARSGDRGICVLRARICAAIRSMENTFPAEKKSVTGSMRAGRRQVAAGAVLLVCGVGGVLGRQDERERRKDIVDMVGPFHSLCACVCVCMRVRIVGGWSRPRLFLCKAEDWSAQLRVAQTY